MRHVTCIWFKRPHVLYLNKNMREFEDLMRGNINLKELRFFYIYIIFANSNKIIIIKYIYTH